MILACELARQLRIDRKRRQLSLRRHAELNRHFHHDVWRAAGRVIPAGNQRSGGGEWIGAAGGTPDGACQPATNAGAAGNGSDPSVAPASTQVTIVSISLAVSDGSFRKWPKRGSARQGGISRARTLLL